MDKPLNISLHAARPKLPRIDKVLLAFALILAALAIHDPGLAREGLAFTLTNLVRIAPFLAGSVLLTAYAAASDLDNLIARAFSGNAILMILLASVAGALSPFCSCGVIPLIAALLAMRVPLASVMAFWLASPLMDPSMFVLTAGTISAEFAIYKAFAAFLTGCIGGAAVMLLDRGKALDNPLRPGVGNGGCGGSRVREPKPISWKFWQDRSRIRTFGAWATKTAGFLGKWLALAYLLESILLTFVPAEAVIALIGDDGFQSIAVAVAVGVPAYLNGFAALPLVAGLMDRGMNPGAAMAFLLAGGVTSIPAAMAVFALVKPRVFAVYISVALVAAFTLGAAFNLVTSLS